MDEQLTVVLVGLVEGGMAMLVHNNPREIRIRRLQALMQVFKKTNRILTGRFVTTNLIYDTLPFPAFTSGTDITFVEPMLGEVETAEDIIRVTGLNYHELGHANFTPSVGYGNNNPLADYVRAGGTPVQQAYNVLEDQRIESMLVALFPSMRHYFTAMFVDYILKNTKAEPGKAPDHSTTFLLSHGRRYLSDDIRDGLRGLFVLPALADDFAAVIDEYRLLNLNTTSGKTEAVKLLKRWMFLRTKLPSSSYSQVDNYAHATNVISAPPEKTPENKAQAVEALKAVEEGADDHGNGGQGGGEDGEESDGEGSGSNDGDDGDDNSESQDGKSAGTGHGGNGVPTTGDSELDEAIAAALEKILSDKNVQNDVRNTQNAIKAVDVPANITHRLDFARRSNPEVTGAARRMGRKLQMLVEEQDPGWERRTSTGRMNIQRAITGTSDLDELYDKWEPGNADASSIETVVAVDYSGSMAGQGTKLAEAAWAIKAAHDSIGVPCTVFGYNYSGSLIYEHNDKALPGKFPVINPGMSTYPDQVVAEAARRLAQSKRKKRLFVVMTDGEWGVGSHGTNPVQYTADEYIASMNAQGVLTALAFYPGERSTKHVKDPGSIQKHNCTIVQLVKDMPALVDMTTDIVNQLIKRR